MSDVLAPVHQPKVRPDRPRLAHELGFGDVGEQSPVVGVVARQITLSDYVCLQAAFDDLADRADMPNPFMSPALVAAAVAGLPEHSVVVLAAFDSTAPSRLLGVWCLRRQRDIWSAGCEILQAPILPRYECQAAPVLDKNHAPAAFAAMLAHVRSAGNVPRVIRVTSWPVALGRLLPAGWHVSTAETWQRAMLQALAPQDAEAYLKHAMGKALNKRNNRQKQLGEQGQIAITARRGNEAVAAFEHYIRLEAKGWKGQSGTSLAEVPADAAYMRSAIAGLARADQVSVDMITLDDVPIAAGVVIEAGGNNLFWKAAFDEDHARFAPGSLLHLAVTRRLFMEGRAALDSGMMEFTSPAHMPWSERADMARVTIASHASPRASVVRLGAALRQLTRHLKRRLTAR